MIVRGWRTGAPNLDTGAGFGIRIRSKDRDEYFDCKWNSVRIGLEDGLIVEARISKTFWGKCPEIRSPQIGKWMLERRLAPWSDYHPPILNLEAIGDRYFRLSRC
jgi:hypothetical protein